MIYTIGHKTSYEQGQKEVYPEKFLKKGRDKDYCGGSVFKTIKDAQKIIDIPKNKEFAIFGLMADWDNDTVKSNEGW